MDKQSARKFLYITLGITAVIIAISIFLVSKKRNEKLALTVQTPDVVSAEEDAKLDAEIKKALDSIDFENFDTDKDGVPDWQENIYGLNPASAQTYGEGTSDKAFMENVSDEGVTDIGLTQNKTEVFARDLYKVSKDPNTIGNLEEVSNSFLKDIKDTQVSKVYTEADIKYTSNYKESFYKYISIVAPFLESTFITKEKMNNFNNDSNEITAKQKILAIKQDVFALEQILISNPPPKLWIFEYIELLNAVAELRTKLSYVLTESTDPILSLTSMTTINDSFRKYYSSYYGMTSKIQTWIESQ